MNNKQISQIASAANTSKATVSKVLNHCYGVSSDVRKKVFLEKDNLSVGSNSKKPVEIYVIIPEVPSYFWSNELSQFENDEFKIKYNIYTRLGDNDIVLRYLDEAEKVNARVIIFVGTINKEIEEKLSHLSKDCLVLFLTEYNQIPNTFYVGSNPENEGERLAEICLREHKKGEKMLLIRDILPHQSKTSELRLNAFLNKLNRYLNYDIIDIELTFDTQFFAASLARVLAPFFKKEHYCSVVCFNGFTHAVCLALQKLRLSPMAKCYSFEDSPRTEKFSKTGILKAVICQDFEEQLSAALNISRDFLKTGTFPDSKFTYLPSLIKIFE